MFLNTLKKNKAKKFLTKYFERQEPSEIEHTSKIHSAACIVNLDEFADASILYSLADDFKIPLEQFYLMGYSEKTKTIRHSQYPLFSFKDVDYKMQITEKNTQSFLEREYDVLINYFTKRRTPLLYLSAVTKAAIRVGFSEMDNRYNDLIFKIDRNNFSLFKTELLNYLRILKKL